MANEEELVDEAMDESQELENQPEVDTEELEAELATEKDRSLRLQAELQNLRARQARELADARKYAGIELMRDILPVLDNVDRAIEAAGEGAEVASLLEGFKLVRQQLLTALDQHNCKQIAAEGEVFDPDYHQAILQQPSPEVPAGVIMMVTQAGYQLHDRVVRAAQVIVSAGPGEIGNIAENDSAGDEATA
ncbi:nucleotide exchange factor GrpE [Aeoliella mucimassa]|uniref:Protein GrpE n=1 Tax=Aeoliella mucimassa TaxID=2527972 RepID=A0A518ATJ8_9BACT|nr:nucleotide exchange factor GrpE [Aeoliella mucimassa]QDU58054.1 heat shock protein GrpE [Aeoliella mucimassa]